ncbi:NUDIX hydrolase [Amycolatopsis sp. NPDC059090]|uniref:NUDIX hydrolase n=1 Tax=unclassified Amycolatopsis TaxID=2618356 RepID=UPI00366E70DC
MNSGAEWAVHGERPVYDSRWVSLSLADVELPTGDRCEHHVLRLPSSAAAAVVDDSRVLMLWRHRFTTRTWGWELPGGMVEPGETPAQAAARETEEETGWRPDVLTELCYLEPLANIADAAQYVFRAEGAAYAGPPADQVEADEIAWIPVAHAVELVAARQIVSAASVAAVLRLALHSRG